MQNKPKKLPVFFSSFGEGHRQISWQPAADIYRTPAGWLVKLDVAGVRLEDIKTEITPTEVRIQGCRRDFQAVEAASITQWRFLTTAFSGLFRSLVI